MNSLRISQSFYAQLTSVYNPFNVEDIVDFQLENLCCFTGEVCQKE